jgi:Fic family protein
MTDMRPLHTLDPTRFESPAILKALGIASRQLAELKGVVLSIPHQGILINSLGLQEAKDSSAIENIVTTHDDLFRTAAFPDASTPASKEVARYSKALKTGFEQVAASGLLTNSHILKIQEELEGNDAGFRKLPGTDLKEDRTGQTIYVPPQEHADILSLMGDLERFINDDALYPVDPLIKMALIHHQFESIHPFYDGNGRTGRIICVLYLVKQGLLHIPVLYLSRHIVETKADYYRLLQDVRDRDAWEPWVLYMLEAVANTASAGIHTVHSIRQALLEVKHRIRSEFKFYSQDLINNLFFHPYTKIAFVEQELNVSRLTASRYLEALVEAGILHKHRVGRSNYYINVRLHEILTGATFQEGA